MSEEKKKQKDRQWDGVSRPSNNLYEKNYKRIFGENSKDSENDDTINTSQYNKVYNEKQQKNKKKTSSK